MTIFLVHLSDGGERVHALFHRLADPNQYSGRERNLLPARIFDHTQAFRRLFIGSVVMRGVLCQQPRARRLQHEANARRDTRQTRQPFSAHQSRIRMRQQARFAQHLFAHRFQIMQCGFVSKMTQRVAHLREKQFRFVAQAEQRLRASHALARADYFHHFVGRHRMRARFARVTPKRAVSTIVAAKVGQRQKHLARISNDAGLKPVASRLRRREQRGQHIIAGAQEHACQFARDRRVADFLQLTDAWVASRR